MDMGGLHLFIVALPLEKDLMIIIVYGMILQGHCGHTVREKWLLLLPN
jgi:hypothetical protein